MDTKLLEMGRRLYAQRKKGLTQDALAKKANVSSRTISHAELGKKAMRADTITSELEHRKSGYVERKRRPYQSNVVRYA